MTTDPTDPANDHPWPKKSDKLFPEQPKTARCRDSDDDRAIGAADYLIREGYYRAAELLATELVEKEREVWPGVMFPMLYCYRHFLELSLKAIMPDLARLANQEISLKLTAEHSLTKLWNEFRKRARKAFPPHEDDEPIDDVVERCINEMNQVDKSSQAFRYSTNTNGKLTADDLPVVEIDQLKSTMENLRSYFEGCDIYAGELLDSQRDIDLLTGK